MDKITLISTFVDKAQKNNNLELSKRIVEQDLLKIFSPLALQSWNTELPQGISDSFLSRVHTAGEVNLEKFVKDLTFEP